MTGVGELIERVEGLKGVLPDNGMSTIDGVDWPAVIAAAFPCPRFDYFSVQNKLLIALRGSLDAAVAFTEALLPGAEWSLDRTADKAIVTMWAKMSCAALASAGKPTPALALVLAALRALAAKEGHP